MPEDIVNIGVKVINSGKKILVVGVQPGNLGELYHTKDKRYVFWNLSSGRFLSKNLPEKTGLVVFTKFIDHNIQKMIRNNVSEDCTVWHEHLGTGRLKEFLREVMRIAEPLAVSKVEEVVGKKTTFFNKPQIKLEVPEVVVSEPEHSPVVVDVQPIETTDSEESEVISGVTNDSEDTPASMNRRAKIGELSEFVTKYADFNKPMSVEEMDRLVNLAESLGIYTSQKSIGSTFYKLKKNEKSASEVVNGTGVDTPSPRVSSRKDNPNKDVSILLTNIRGQLEQVLNIASDLNEENKRLKEEKEELIEAKRMAEAKFESYKRSIQEALSKV